MMIIKMVKRSWLALLIAILLLCTVTEAQPDSWNVPVTVSDGETDIQLMFGVDPGAKNGFDELDKPAPPPPVDISVLYSYFLIDDRDSPTESLLHDIHNATTSTWSLRVHQSSKDTIISWDVSDVPANIVLSLKIEDSEIDMKSQDSVVIPSDVDTIQFMSEEQISQCFIATAAYGTPLHEDIEVLRDFRDEYLMTNPLGREFVRMYYETSPPIAEVISEHEWLRTAVREGMVKPLVYIVRGFILSGLPIKDLKDKGDNYIYQNEKRHQFHQFKNYNSTTIV